MSTVSLPSYIDPSSPLNRTPSYSLEPHDYERRIALADRLRPRPSGNFVKESKGGGVRLRLTAQEDNVELPVYGLGDHVSGTVELSKTEGITSVEVKIEGKLRLKEIAEGGTAAASLVLDTATLWFKDRVNHTCPTTLSFSLALPNTFQYEDQTYLLPPTFDVKLSGLPGFIGTIEYSVTAIVAKPNQNVPIPKVNSKALGIHIGSSIVSTPFIYFPRSKPAAPIPLSLKHSLSGFEITPDWKMTEYTLHSVAQNRPHITTKLYLPASRIFSMTMSIPFHLTLESSAVSLAAFLPLSPTSNTFNRKITRIQLMRQTTVDVRNTTMYGVKTDMWRVDCIGEGTFTHAGDGPSHISFSGEIPLDPKVIKVPAFRAAGLSVKDCILFTITPLDPGKAPFAPLREVVPVRLATDPWTPNGTGIGAERAFAMFETPTPPTPSPK
ncbi:hypothetical protein BDN70DRAFT_799620 [Pholiota conissans]|uniref:Uncharacterized protein n=1 Tax=Pholiota conissans TaxID=109636 RepID=A0A9P5ZAX9_9AGAR|nr:hypothetical protein BDN70DRAFT_799620 [Pholiota conissans]